VGRHEGRLPLLSPPFSSRFSERDAHRTVMARRIKALLYRVLGRRWYLYLVSQLFFLAYRTGLLRDDPEYACHYYVRRFVEPGDTVIDIGANLGYYTVLFAEWVGEDGRVYSVEPVPLFRKILRRNARSFAQVEVVPYALGSEAATVQMGVPASAASHRHGMTRIVSSEDEATFEAEVRTPETLFRDLARLDYVKCDVEGHEGKVLPAMTSLLEEHRPIVQVEVADQNRRLIYDLMAEMDYQGYFVEGDTLVEIQSPTDRTKGDWIFRPQSL
jgi:FkbM family methyltransferase